jgi:superfamily II DNA or RNA helicase
MTTKIVKTILTKEGYLLNKKHFKDCEVRMIKKELTVKPANTFVMGSKKDDSELEFEVFRENDEYLSIPKFYGIKKLGEPDKNDEIIGESMKMKFTGSLRPLQEDIVNETLEHLLKYDGGGICVGCGSGKTVMAIYIAQILKVKTLVIVHKSFLLNQWKERFEQFSDAKIGIIQQKKVECEGKDVVIGMLQSIAKEKYDFDIFRDFGLVIFDEAHHAPSKFFSKALPLISCKKTLFLTATPKRSDSLEKILYWYFGDIIYKAPPDKNNNVLVKIMKYNITNDKFRESYIPYTGEVNRPRTITRVTKITKRNKFIITCIKDILVEEGRKILVLSDRIEHLDKLKYYLDKAKVYSDYYVGGMKQAKLDKATEATVILASYGMASEALDIPTLNTLIMATPRRSIEQSVGRILRSKEHIIQPLIIDIVDSIPFMDKQGFERRKFYKKLKYQIKLIDVEENEILGEEDITDCKATNTKEICNNIEDVNFVD